MRKLRRFWFSYDLDVLVVLAVLLIFLRPGLVALHLSVTPFNQHGGTTW
jgi:hypothetical protein